MARSPSSNPPGANDPVVRLRVRLPKTEISTAYGVRFREGQGADHFVELATKAGFRIVSRKDESGWFMLELRKGS